MLRLQAVKDLAMHKSLPAIMSLVALINLDTSVVAIASSLPEVMGVHVAQQPSCDNPQTQTEMNICAGISYRNADKRLNQVYQQLLPKLPSSRRQKLTTAQQAWIKFRDTNCAFESSKVEGGTIAPLVYSSCLVKITKQRTVEIEEYLKDDR